MLRPAVVEEAAVLISTRASIGSTLHFLGPSMGCTVYPESEEK
jgi:hypothetical protein